MVVFRLAEWSRRIPTRFHVPRRTQDTSSRSTHFVYGGITLYAQISQSVLLYVDFVTLTKVLQPRPVERFGLFPVRSPLLGESLIYFLFLLVLRCFSSQGSLHATYVFSGRIIRGKSYWVSPFGYHRIKAHFQLPDAFRR